MSAVGRSRPMIVQSPRTPYTTAAAAFGAGSVRARPCMGISASRISPAVGTSCTAATARPSATAAASSASRRAAIGVGPARKPRHRA